MTNGHKPDSNSTWHRWIVFVAPLVAFFLIGTLLPSAWPETLDAEGYETDSPSLAITMTCARVFIMLGLVAVTFRSLVAYFPFRVSFQSLIFGTVGAALWIAICYFNVEGFVLTKLGLAPDFLGSRNAINPWELFDDPLQRNIFWIARFTLLIVAVPIAEELTLRGCLIRAVDHESWDTLPLEHVSRTGLLVATLYGVLSHPNEAIAAAVWFSMISYLMVRTKNFWDCVIAHAITNGILGIYIVVSGDWHLW